MEIKNAKVNLFIKQMNQSDAMAYNMEYVATPTNQDYGILNRAYANTGKIYAQLKTTIESNKCIEPGCTYEIEQISRLETAPQKSLDFLSSIGSSVATIFGGDIGSMVKTGATTMLKNRMAGGGADQPSLLTKPQSLGTSEMPTYALDAPEETKSPEVADYENFLAEWTEIMRRFARYQ